MTPYPYAGCGSREAGCAGGRAALLRRWSLVLDEFADAIAGADHRDVLPLGPAHHDKVPRCANSCEGIDPYHRLIDSSPPFWFNLGADT